MSSKIIIGRHVCLSLLLSLLCACSTPSQSVEKQTSLDTSLASGTQHETHGVGKTPTELSISSKDMKVKLRAPVGVSRWEPSGVATLTHGSDEFLWMVSDKLGYLAGYKLPIKQGSQRPDFSSQLTIGDGKRVKWEGIAIERNTQGQSKALLLLEAFSRTIWRCAEPLKGCPSLHRLSGGQTNQAVNQLILSPFRYVMFEALSFTSEPVIGIRAFHHKKQGLKPWSIFYASESGRIFRDDRVSISYKNKHFGMSGSHIDTVRGGVWMTWSYEDENSKGRSSVAGLLTYSQLVPSPQKTLSDLSPSKLEDSDPIKRCVYFQLKPEGVTLNRSGDLIVVFDHDRDRKLSKDEPQSDRFSLNHDEDYLWTKSSTEVMSHCVVHSQ